MRSVVRTRREPTTVHAQGNTIRNCLAGARKLLDLKLHSAAVIEIPKIGPKATESGPNVYRAVLSTGDTVICTIVSPVRGERCSFRVPSFSKVLTYYPKGPW